MGGGYNFTDLVEINRDNMFALKSFLFVFSVISMGAATFVDTLKKCSIYDDECIKALHQNIVYSVAQNGIPELNFPPLDPLHIKDVSIQILETLKGSLENGRIEGIGKCFYNDFKIDVKNQVTKMDVVCDIVLEGTVKLEGCNPDIEAILGTPSVNAYGKGKLQMDKLNFKFEAPFRLVKSGNGDIHMKVDSKSVVYSYDLPSAVFSADKITIGNQDISKVGADYLNQHYNMMMKTFGRIFLDEAVVIYFDVSNDFFAKVPISKYVTEDLSPFVKH